MVKCGVCAKELPPEFGEMPLQACTECESMCLHFELMIEPGRIRYPQPHLLVECLGPLLRLSDQMPYLVGCC
jgi:hypothetical protein